MKKIYIVQIGSGQYDESRTWIDSVWETMDEALAAIKNINAEVDIQKKLKPPLKESKFLNATPKKQEEFLDWQTKVNEATDFNVAWVCEFRVGARATFDDPNN